MAGNKYGTVFQPVIISDLELTYIGLYGDKCKLTGTPQQIINFLIKSNYECKQNV